ncbi:PRC-barrel domain-containing protein [Myxococcota bacterium]|nr:PRC-barrel domain-containing protein [Myxococcota bacterium]
MRTTTNTATLAWLAAAGLLIPGAAAWGQEKPRGQRKNTATQSSMANVHVVDAETLIGTTVRSNDGKDLGEIEYLLIRTSDGSMRYAVIEAEGPLAASEGGAQGNMVAIPWSAMSKDVDQGSLRIEVSQAHAARAPRVTEAGLNELLSPTMVTRIDEHWIPVEGQRASGSPSGSGGQGKAGQVKSPTSGQRPASGQSDASAQSQRQAQGTKSKGSSQRGQAQDIDVLVSRTAVTTLVPAAMTKADALEDSEVVSADDVEVGEIDTVAIDLARGRVAYVLLSRGGFLGLGEDILPVPFEALEFRGADQPLRLSVDSARVRKMEAFKGADMPRRVREADLARLYERFGVKPYWTQPRDERASR